MCVESLARDYENYVVFSFCSGVDTWEGRRDSLNCEICSVLERWKLGRRKGKPGSGEGGVNERRLCEESEHCVFKQRLEYDFDNDNDNDNDDGDRDWSSINKKHDNKNSHTHIIPPCFYG